MTFSSPAEILAWRGLNQPTRRAFSFLREGSVERPLHLTYGELDQRARQIAQFLRNSVDYRQRPILLLFPPGLEIICALFGCFYAGAIAVIADFPRRVSSLSTIDSIIENAGVTAVLTTVLDAIAPHSKRSEKLGRLRGLSLDETARSAAPAVFNTPEILPDSIAVLQYTSGSTGEPKGVMVSHGNIVENCAVIKRRFLLNEDTGAVFWLPLSHDMGLVGGVFQPLYTGYPGTLMPPLSFVQKPIRWLHAMSALRATMSAAPNFAYDLCVHKTAPSERDGLDLSSWAVAINGAEPVRADTIERFTEFFSACGFRRDAFCPSYGLAEATLLVCGEKRDFPPTLRQVPALDRGEYLSLVGCGRPAGEHALTIVDPELRVPCKAGETGEVWLAGTSVAKGYWNRPQETDATFGAYLSDSGKGPFLRTGDLGLILEQELFVSGRLKDLIIIRGINYSPEAIELTVESCHPALRPSAGAAFTVATDRGERLVVAHELERSFLRTAAYEEVFEAIRSAVSERHELQVQRIALLKTAGLPKTVTGKTKRQTCRENYLAGLLDIAAHWSSDGDSDGEAKKALLAAMPSQATKREQALIEWLVQKVSEQLNVSPSDVDITRPFAEYGFDSAAVVGLAGDLQDYLGQELSPTLVYDYPTIQALCLHLADSAPAQEPSDGR